MESIKVKTKLFKDFNFSVLWDTINSEFEVEIIGNKAKVHTNTVFTYKRVSKLSKLHMCGSSTGGTTPPKYMYRFIVNGNLAYMIIEHNIPNV